MPHTARCLAFASMLSAVTAQMTQSGFTEISISDALQRARVGRCAVLIDFSSPACEPCRRLDQTTWKDASVLEWIRANVIAIRRDPEKDTRLAEKHRVDAYPTVVLLAADGKEQGRIVGYLDALAMQRGLEELQMKSVDWDIRERVGDALAARGDKEGALQQYLWCWDHGLENNPSMRGVRGSFFLEKLLRFAQSYPVSREAIESRRDEVEKCILAGDLDAAHEMVRLNEHLDTRPRSLAVFEKIPTDRWKKKDAGWRRELFEAVLEQLVVTRRYADILRLGDDPQEELAARLTWRQFPPMPADVRARKIEHILNIFVPIVEAYYGMREDKAAVALANNLLDLRSDATTWLLLIGAAKRAGHDIAANDLFARALRDLPEEQRDIIRQSLKVK